MDTIEPTKTRMRRRHGAELKERVLAECAAPGASVAAVAMTHDLNANLVHRWRRLTEAAHRSPSPALPSFVPVTVASVASTPLVEDLAQCIDVELQRGATSVKVRWPATAADSCGAWLRELLR